MKRWLIFIFMLTALMAFTNLAPAQQRTVTPTYPPPTLPPPTPGHLHPDLRKGGQATLVMTGKVTQVNPTAKTFTVMAKGQAVTFSAAKLNALPKVGEILDITYTQTPGGPMESINLNSSKSNIY